MTRPAAILRAEIARQRQARDAHARARARRDLEALTASLIIQTLAYALGETPSPTTRAR